MTKLPAAEVHAARYGRIVAAAAKGESPATIAAREGVTERTVRRALKRDRDRQRGPDRRVVLDAPDVVEVDPFREFAEVLAASRYAEEELRALAARTGNDSAKTGALKASAQIARDRLSILVEVGYAPPGVTWLQEFEWTAAYETLIAVSREAGLDPEELNTKLAKRLRPWGPSTDVRVIGVGSRRDAAQEAA